ncbi:HNH endonuclease family protein [Microbacterium sp. NPDC016588]|uniref:HNH endonuclease family protein n=1 Tax=Microbacterium TaxID=33882 RepID=UPI0007F3B594|nr:MULTISPECIES: HNH endonuclease family protein [unclassified Microbacterium]OAN39365.1 deoxyribonuclease [Microbacterium sp. H83]TCJ21207.1 HNH endonuclease [Microbacterium sp. PI-1]
MRTRTRRTLGATLTAIAAAIVAAVVLPTLPQTPEDVTPAPAIAVTTETPAQQLSPDAAAAMDLLEALAPAEPANQDTYERDDFGQRWADIDRNGCDQRNDVLARDLTDTTTKPGTHECVVLTGTLHDPYTGSTIVFQRGQATSEFVQIDHIVPLAWAWRQGADTWSIEQRETFANDPLNLQATDGPTNQSKSDRGPGDWMPPDTSYACTYAARFIEILATYQLTINTTDRSALATQLTSCSA